MDFKYYKATIKSDTGKRIIYTSAQDEYSAKFLIHVCECCPLNSIHTTEVTKQQFRKGTITKLTD